MFLQQCENYRNDVNTIYLPHASYDWYVPTQSKNYPNLVFPGKVYSPKRGENKFNLEDFIDANINNTSIFTVNIPFDLPKKYILFPHGLFYKIIRKSDGISTNDFKKSVEYLPTFKIPTKYTIDSWDKLLVEQYWNSYDVLLLLYLDRNKICIRK